MPGEGKMDLSRPRARHIVNKIPINSGQQIPIQNSRTVNSR